MDTTSNDESIKVVCNMLMDAIRVHPDARPVLISIIETLMDNYVPHESWGTIFFYVWPQVHDEPSAGKEPP